MRLTLYIDDYETEKIFSYLRWIFLVVAVILFYFPPVSSQLSFERTSFPMLLAIGFLYMGITQFTLHRMDPNDKYFPLITKLGAVFDYIALFWLLILSGGVNSPLFPISYLLIMHATIYWRTKGAIVSSIAVTIGYFILLLFSSFSFEEVFIFCLNLGFTGIIGFFGSMIVIRERVHMKQKKIFHELVVTDDLTGLFNHRHFQEHIRNLKDQSAPFYLVMGDIDYFKLVNDRYGHCVGDQVLRVLGENFNSLVKNYNGQAFRYGGEEFTFLLPDHGIVELKRFFHELYETLNMTTFTEEGWSVTMSFGVTESSYSELPNQLLVCADQFLYKSKSNGKNQVQGHQGLIYANKNKEGFHKNKTGIV